MTTAFWQCAEVSEWQSVTEVDRGADAALHYLIVAWKSLPPHIRESILTLVDAAQRKPLAVEVRHERS